MYDCSNGALTTYYYNDANCTSSATPYLYSNSCQVYPLGSVKYGCVTPSSTAPSRPPTEQSYVIYQIYSTLDCNGTTSTIVGYVQNACIDNSYASSIVSDLYTCINNVPYDNEYTGSATCNGISQSYDLPVTCTR